MSTILITGGRGLIGSALTDALLKQGHVVRHLGRTKGGRKDVHEFRWNVANGTVEEEALLGADHLVHLAGAGIADKRWTPKRVKQLIDSRAETAHLLLRTAKRIGTEPKSFVSAAGVGYYGATTQDMEFTEQDGPATDTIGRISREWEVAVDEWTSLCRTVKLRMPIVLSGKGGALKKMSLPVSLGLGTPLGNGEQWMPWVHIDDLVAIYAKALFDEGMHGIYNVNNGQDVTNAEFLWTLARVLRRPFFLPPLPGFLLKLWLGEMASIVLEGSRIGNQRLLSTGYQFRHTELEPAIRSLLGKGSQ